MQSKGIPLHEFWRRTYRANRYCRNLNQTELNIRIRDVFINLLRLTPEGKISLPPMEIDGGRSMELWTHVLEEMSLRHGPYPNGFTREILHTEPFPDLVGELGLKAASVLSSSGLKTEDVFVKYGKKRYMQGLFEEGSLRIQAASFYATPDHNGAVRDDELALSMSLSLTREDIVKIVQNPQDVPSNPIDHRLDITQTMGTDYWIYCLATAIEPRLFVDFEADACVIIKDKSRFQDLLVRQTGTRIPGAIHRQGNAIYIDPLLPAMGIIDVPMSKHFRYKYQNEYRFVWIPRESKTKLPFVDLTLGALGEFAEFITL